MLTTQCYECTHNMVDTGNTELNDYLNGEFAKTGAYNPACATNKSQVALTTCASGCLASHVTGSLVLEGKINQLPVNTR